MNIEWGTLALLGTPNKNKESKTWTKDSKIKRLQSTMPPVFKYLNHDYSV